MAAVLEEPVTSETDDFARDVRFEVERIHRELADRWPRRKVEIVDGAVVIRPMPTFKHGMTTDRLHDLIRDAQREHGWVHPRDIGVFLGPQGDRYRPDLTITLAEPRLWGDDHVHGEDTRLVVEVVSESSADDDHNIKPKNCAIGGVPIYLLIDTFDEVVKVFSEPSDKGYARMVEVRLGEPLDLPDPWNVTIETTDLA